MQAPKIEQVQFSIVFIKHNKTCQNVVLFTECSAEPQQTISHDASHVVQTTPFVVNH